MIGSGQGRLRWHKPVSALRLLGSRPLACPGTPLPAKDIPMTAITWSEALALKQPRMDQTHREFIDLLQALAAAPGAGTTDFDPLLAELQTHTEPRLAAWRALATCVFPRSTACARSMPPPAWAASSAPPKAWPSPPARWPSGWRRWKTCSARRCSCATAARCSPPPPAWTTCRRCVPRWPCWRRCRSTSARMPAPGACASARHPPSPAWCWCRRWRTSAAPTRASTSRWCCRSRFWTTRPTARRRPTWRCAMATPRRWAARC
jgi:hypothetical protein